MTPRCAWWFLSFALVVSPGLLLGAEPPRLDRYGDPLPQGAVARMGTARLRVDQRVAAFAFWPDDRTLAACCADGSVRLWERATGREVRRLQTRLSFVRSAVFVAGKKTVALLGDENEFLLWDTAAAKSIWRISLPDYYRERGCLAASPDGKLLAVLETKKKVGLYDAASGRKVRSLEEIEAKTLVFSPDSTLLAIASSKPPVHLWDIRTGKKVRDLSNAEKFSVQSLAFSQDGKMIAEGYRGHAVVFEAATGKELSRLKFDHDVTQGGLLFTADGKTLITGHYPGFVYFWDLKTWKKRLSRKGIWQQGAWPMLSRDGKVLAVGDQQGRGYRFLRLLDPATGKDVGPPADGHEFELNFVAFSPDGKTLLSGDRESIRQWTPTTGESGRRISWSFPEYTALSADRKLLAAPWDYLVQLWQPGHEKPVRSLEYKGKDMIRAVAFSPDGKYLLSAHNHCTPRVFEDKIVGQDGLHFWDLATAKEIRSSSTPTKDLYSHLVIAPDGRTAIAGSTIGRVNRIANSSSTFTESEGAGQLYLWDLPSGRQIRTLEGHRGAIRSLALSGDGRLLVSGSADQTVRLWELASGKTLYTLPTAKTYRPATALSSDGRLVAAARSSTLCLWSTATGKPVLELRGHDSGVRSLAFSSDNRRLASGLSNGTILIWDVASACRAVRPEQRRLSPKEREALWTSLADADAANAQRAVGALVAGGPSAVEMLKGRLRPAEDVAPKRLQKLLADLDADQYAVREAATRALEKLDERAEPVLSAVLKGRPSLEVRKRIEELLARLGRREWSPERLREMRAVMVLEQIGSAEAREVLQSLAKGCADDWLTWEAKASRARLKRSPPRQRRSAPNSPR